MACGDGGRGHGLQHLEGEALVLVEDGDGPVQAFVDLDAGLGVGVPVRAGQELHVVRPEGT